MSRFDSPPPTAPFDHATVKERISRAGLTLVKAMIIPAEAERLMADESAGAKFGDQLMHLVGDAMSTSGEVGRLYGRFEELQRKHAPFAGEPGAPAVCTGCSLYGVQVPWPCDVYNFATKSLPERR